jgi:hypothetical protein
VREKTRDKWIVALQSNEYDQCFGAFKDTEFYCALGVLCDILGAKWNKDDDGYWRPSDKDLPVDRLLPPGFQAGLSKEQEDEIVKLNDGLHRSFEAIATYVEKNF